MNNTERAVLQALVDTARVAYFTAGYQASDPEAMGLLLSKFFHFDGVDILRAAYYGLEDANFHTQAGQLGAMIEELTKADDDELIDRVTRQAVFAAMGEVYGKDITKDENRAKRLNILSKLAGKRIHSLSDRRGDMTMGDAHRVLDALSTLREARAWPIVNVRPLI